MNIVYTKPYWNMKKCVLLLSFFLGTLGLSAQIDTLFRETFSPSDSVTTLPLGTATGTWKDTSNLFISPPSSYHARVEPAAQGSNSSEVVFRTDSFSTVGYSFVFLEFYHIAKMFPSNQGLIRISTDGGNNWTLINNNNVTYLGNSSWPSSSNFQEGVYNIPNQGINHWFAGTDPPPQQSWWQFEKFDISNLALGAGGAGFSDVRIEFSAFFVLNPTQLPPPINRPFGAGWWVDNLLITGSTCELFPPRFSFNYVPIPCFPIRPQGGLTEEPSGNYKIGARVTDSVPGGTTANNFSDIDSVTVFYRVTDSNGVTGAWQYVNMVKTNVTFSEWEATIPSISLGDTVEYYYKAWDLACPNITRVPDSIANPADPYYRFWPESGLPFKCGVPDCGSVPGTISQFPWVENFEGPQWVAGSGVGDNGNSHRGNFPDEQRGLNYWQVQPGTNAASGYGWSIRIGQTGTPFTGPLRNHTPGGQKYLYAEASQGPNNSTTTLVTPCIDMTRLVDCHALEFYYHFFGEDVGTMRIDVDTGRNNPAWWTGYYFIRKEQQTSQNDPWERALVPLKQFNGQFIRLRFLSAKQTTKSGTNIRGDMAIDDLKIFKPIPTDAEVLAVTSPEPGLCSYGTEPIDVVVRNNGCDSLTTLNLQYRLNTNGVNGAIQNFTTSLALRTGDTTTVSITPGVNLSALGTYYVDVWANAVGDTIADNDTARSPTVVHQANWTSFPYLLDFESGTVGTNQTGSSLFTTETGLDPNYRWLVGERFTDTRNTGPKGGYYKGGKYMYSEATGSTGDVNTFLVTTQCLDFTGLSNPTLDFYYHMLGTNINRVEVEVNEPATMGADNWQVVPGSTISGAQQTSVMDDFEFKRVNLSAYANKQIKLRIKARRNGAGDLADIAIDKVMIYDRIANDAGVEILMQVLFNNTDALALIADSTVTSQYPANILRANAQVRNFGTSSISNEQVTFAVTPLCGPSAGTTTTYTTSNGATIGPGQETRVTDNNLALVLPKGACEVCAYTSVSGDNHTFNDTACRIITGWGTYDIDFADNFDPCGAEASGFYSQVGYLQWEHGEAPPGSRFSSAQAGDNIWATNLTDGYFLDGLEERLRVPELDNFDTVVAPTIRFFQNVDMGSNAAGAIEYFAGGQWQTLGGSSGGGTGAFQGVGQNWYTNSPAGTLGSPVTSIDEGFTGSSNGWMYSVYPMRELNFNPNAISLRFRFESNPNSNAGRNFEGWAIDDFEVIIPPQNSASPANFRFLNPLQIPFQDQRLSVVIQNTGAKLLDTCDVKAEILTGGTITWSGNWEGVKFPRFFTEGSNFRYEYQQVWPAATVTSGPHTLRLITRRPNEKMDNRPLDDTLETQIFVLPEYYYNSAQGDTIFCNDFEPNNGSLDFAGYNSLFNPTAPQSWELGTPVQFPGAFSGQNAWMTDLDGDYIIRDQSSLVSPVFVVERDTNYELSFMHQFHTEKYHDGGAVEVSLNGGIDWTVVGFANEANWYNTDFVTALDIIKPGWSDVSNGWDTARYVVRFDTTVERAVFRWRFESDYAVQRPGWAIDDVCFKMSPDRAGFFIGNEEFQPTPDTYVGSLSPNPTADVTYLPIFAAQSQPVGLEVFNVVGQSVWSEQYIVERGTNRITLEAFDWKPGVYFVNVLIQGKRLTRKLVVR